MILRSKIPLSTRPVRWPYDGLPFDMRALRFVLAAAEQMSFSGAAQALNIRVSTVSRRVRDFEDEIGVTLFERTPAGVRLTYAGEKFLSEILPAILQIEAALSHAGAAGRVEQGKIRIGITTTLGGGFLRDLISAFRQSFNGVQLVLRDGGRREHLRALRSRSLDVAFITGSMPLADCDSEQLWQERIHVAMPTTHPLANLATLSWPELFDERFIVSTHEPGPEVHDYIVRRVASFSIYPDIMYRSVNQETLMHLVGIGEGITFVSEGWVKVAFPDLVLRPLSASDDIMPFCAVWSPLNDNPALRRFISFARTLSSNAQSSEVDH